MDGLLGPNSIIVVYMDPLGKNCKNAMLSGRVFETSGPDRGQSSVHQVLVLSALRALRPVVRHSREYRLRV